MLGRDELRRGAGPDGNLAAALQALLPSFNCPTRSIGDISYFGNFPYDVLSPVGFKGPCYAARARLSFCRGAALPQGRARPLRHKVTARSCSAQQRKRATSRPH